VASVETERLSVVLISDAPATARDFDVPPRRAPSAGTLVDMTEVRPHQPTTYDIRGGRRPVRTFSSPSPSGSLTPPQSAKGEASMKMLTSISVGRKRFLDGSFKWSDAGSNKVRRVHANTVP